MSTKANNNNNTKNNKSPGKNENATLPKLPKNSDNKNTTKNNNTNKNTNKNTTKNTTKTDNVADFSKYNISLSNINNNLLNNINKQAEAVRDPEASKMKEAYEKKEEVVKNIKETGETIRQGAQETAAKIKEGVEETGKQIKKGIETTTNTVKSTLGIETNKTSMNNTSKKNSTGKKSNELNNKKNITEKSPASTSTIILKIFKYILITAIVVGIITAAWYYYKNIYSSVDNKYITIIDKAKKGDIPLVISQDPDTENHVKITKPSGQPGGIEFTYSFWIVISDLEKKGEWKHIFHKGNKSSFPNRAPGVWLHPNKNDLRIYMNTTEDPLSYLDIEQIPMKKWVNVTMVYTEAPQGGDKKHVLDVFINGMLKKTKSFKSLVQLNDGDFWINMFSGFNGLLAKIKYINRGITLEEVQSLASNCPNDDTCGIDADCPPYLDTQWWFN
jgi:hypothetical protein